MSTQPFEALDKHLKAYVETGKLAGFNALIEQAGGPRYRRSYGYSDISKERKMGPDTIFRIYSLTKPITAVAVMQLYEQGHILLTDSIGDYLPELKNLKVYKSGADRSIKLEPSRRDPTIFELLTHTSGLSYGNDEDHPVDRLYNAARLFHRDGTIEDMVSRLGLLPLKFQPGTSFDYSVSYDVLGRLIEVVTGQPLDEYMLAHIFQPLEMIDTDFVVPFEKLDRLASMYHTTIDGKLEIEDDFETTRFLSPVTFFAGGEGLVSTIRDCQRFLHMMLQGGELDGVQCLSPKTVMQMTTNHLTETQMSKYWLDGHGYGLGFGMIVNPTQSKNAGPVGEFGWAGSGNTYFWANPDDQLISILFSQFVPSSQYAVAREFKALMYKSISSNG